MKVSLIWAKGQAGYNMSPPLGVCYVAAFIRRKLDIVPDIIDAHLHRLNVDQVLDKIMENKYDVVGISFMTPQADFAFELTKAIKGANKNICVVHGGTHPTVRPKESIENSADYCVIGEGEITFKELLECIKSGKEPKDVNGLAYRSENEIIFTRPREFIQDLDSVPFPAFDLIPVREYRENIHIREGLALPIIGSRGCPHNCSFCASPAIWRRKVRYRSPENILDEIEKYIQKYDIRKFHFYDDNFLLGVKKMKEFCEAVEKRDLDMEWICLARTDTINKHPEILTTMKNAGCVGLEIGVESLDSKVLKSTNKKIKPSDSLNALKLMSDSGMEIACLQLMTFNVGETIFGHYIQNKNLVDVTGEKRVFFGQFATPYPGSRFGESASDDGMVLVERWQDYVTSNVNFVPNEMLKEKPKRTLKYLRLSDSLIIVRELRNVEDFALSVRNVLNTLIKIRFFYKHCNGHTSIYDIFRYMNKKFGMKKSDAMAYTVKVLVIMSQLGLIKPNDMKQYPQKIVPDWQKRYFGFDSNLNMNLYLFSRFVRSWLRNLAG